MISPLRETFSRAGGDELADLREGFDGRHGALDFGAGQPHDFAVEEHVLAAGEFGVEARAQLQQGGDAPARDYPSLRGLQDAGHDLQKRAFAGAVRANQGQGLALFDLEADIAQGPKVGVERTLVERQGLAEAVGGTAVELVELGYDLKDRKSVV